MAYQSPQILPPIYNNEKLVVYGLIKHLKDTRGLIQGNVVLRGEILGDSFQHTVPIGSTPNSSGIYPVHRLAAKGLITDWQDAGMSKDSIITLSVESSVVSKHTAFIAVDEENSVPIEGAMKSWDINCEESQMLVLNSLIGQSHMVMQQNIDKVMQRDECLDYQADCLSSQASNFAARPKKKKSGFSLPSFGFFRKNASESKSRSVASKEASRTYSSDMISAQITDDLSDDDSYCEEEEEESDDCAPQALSSTPQAFSSAPTVPSMKTVISPTSIGSTDILTSVIASQQANGSWRLDSSIAKIFRMSVKEVEDACPQVLKENRMVMIWVTVLVLTVLEKKCSNHKDEWELLDLKARSWLKKQSLPSGMKVNEIFTAAESCQKAV